MSWKLGIFIGSGNPLGGHIPVAEAERHVFGLCLLNDWSARDIQGWEYQPLGPFLAKSFLTTISPWIVTLEGVGAVSPSMDPRHRRSATAALPGLDVTAAVRRHRPGIGGLH